MPKLVERREVTLREKVDALLAAAWYNPLLATLIVIFGLIAAVLEGVGMTFIIPIIEIVQVEDPVAEADGVMLYFVAAYQLIGLPFTLGFVIFGVSVIMSIRYTMSFLVSWLRGRIQYEYRRDLQLQAYNSALEAEIQYFDTEGSDEILNAIITEAREASTVVKRLVSFVEVLFLTLVYLIIAFWIAPWLTVISVAVLGGLTVLIRHAVEPGYNVGDRVAEANERRHSAAQAGMMGIRDVRLFDHADEMYQKFRDAVELYTVNKIKLRRNEAAIRQFYNLAVAVFVFSLIYIALVFANLSFGELGLFLFLMFQLGPKMSSMNKSLYEIENNLPHLVRTQQFIHELESRQEPIEGEVPAPSEVEHVEFDDVWFSYNDDEEPVLRGLDFEVSKGEFVAFVGQSGTGKSTIVSLLTRFYLPDRGRILANGRLVEQFDIKSWRDRLAIVRQSPFIFNESLRYNLTIGNRDATQTEIEQACEIAKVDEFFDDLSNGYETELGDDGVQLSGGQKQRVALARALLKDADLLILDEATSDLDSNLEAEVKRGIEAMDREYAIITIAHQLSTVENADRIYTLIDGQISERGSHRELVENDGKYAELYQIQSR